MLQVPVRPSPYSGTSISFGVHERNRAVTQPVSIMPCLDMQNGRVVKGFHFVDIRDAGDPVECAQAYCKAGADELALLDITATVEGRGTMLDVVRRVSCRMSSNSSLMEEPFSMNTSYGRLLRKYSVSLANSVSGQPIVVTNGCSQFSSRVFGSAPALCFFTTPTVPAGRCCRRVCRPRRRTDRAWRRTSCTAAFRRGRPGGGRR